MDDLENESHWDKEETVNRAVTGKFKPVRLESLVVPWFLLCKHVALVHACVCVRERERELYMSLC